ncbi:MAG: ATP-binding cassette domain-containing protein [Ilumatobacteraceae bacterium]|nr:ATP-binding cassette domain-containing protein [Ilumatobacteraceae bacterium]
MAGTGTAHLHPDGDVVLRVADLTVEFPIGRDDVVQAVSGISFDIRRGETLGLVGESGCGKSTTGRAVLQLPRPTSGTVSFDGVDLGALSDEALRRTRIRMQMILQDPVSSLNPRRTIRQIVGEGLTIWGRNEGRDERIDEVLTAVGLDPELVRDRRPHQFSGGQCQRICIARALALEPELLICDEPVSALDVSVQAQLLNLIREMKAAYTLTMMFIAHDLAVVRNISDRVIVMYLGKICEVADADTLFDAAAHPYTQALVQAVPNPDPRLPVAPAGLKGELPSPLAPPSGCRFRTRCPLATDICAAEEPQVRRLGPGHFVACHHAEAPVAT